MCQTDLDGPLPGLGGDVNISSDILSSGLEGSEIWARSSQVQRKKQPIVMYWIRDTEKRAMLKGAYWGQRETNGIGDYTTK